MTLQEIKDSGLLELYALGEISDENRVIVEKALNDYPDLVEDLKEISRALEAFARASAIIPSPNLKENILESARKKEFGNNNPTANLGTRKKNIPGLSWILVLSALIAVVSALAFYQRNTISKIKQDLQFAENRCDSIVNQQEQELDILRELQNPKNQIFAFAATDNFNSTKISLFSNLEQKRNYLKINELPVINEDQAFQLWSLKEGIDPIPLTVFTAQDGFIIPVDFEQGTGTYAITIEPKGGSQSPTLSNLIATVTVA